MTWQPRGTMAAIIVAALTFGASLETTALGGQEGRNAVDHKLPNVILVMADDMGIGDITPTNPDCKIKTPNLQAMANQGLTFFDAHTPSSVCTPTRYGLLTGRYNWRSRLARGVLSGTSAHLIPADRPTLGHLMQRAGYHTAMLGKWHLGWDWFKKGKKIDFTQPVKNGPDINGFDQYYAHCGSLDMPPYVWVDTGHITAQPNRVQGVTKKEDRYGWYRNGPVGADFTMDQVLPHLFNKSIAHIKQRAAAARAGKPFFLYLALPAPHTPILPIPPFKGASGLNPYGDYVIEVDHYMGQVLAAVKEAGIDSETLVIFTSDNGCSPEANFELLKSKGHDPSAGYRGYKADIYEGGHRVPLIVRWPGHIEGGRQTRALACLTDIYPTLEEITDQHRQRRGGEDGFSLVPVLRGAATSGRDTLISHSISGRFSIRQGPWKLCLAAGSGGWSAPRDKVAEKEGLPPMQLFNLVKDRGEQHNLLAKYPDKVAALLRELDRQIRNGRCTPGAALLNDRKIKFLPKGVEIAAAGAGSASAATLKVTTFKCDVTPPLGQPIYSSYQPLAVIEFPLLAKGVVLDDGHDRYVLCAVDYCELRNGAHALFQREIAKAVGTVPAHVAVQSVHQHTAPMVDMDAVRILEKFDDVPPHPENRVFEEAAARLAKAAKASLATFQTCDSLGLGAARVDRVAATRRVKAKDGTIIVRWSSCTDPKLRAMPEGRIDPKIKVITFAHGKRPVVRLFYYATHPQSFYGDPRASYDVPGIARERLEEEEGIPEIYFTGCAGDVTMGKYNDGTKQARTELAKRLHAGMQAAVAATRYGPIEPITWRTYPLVMPRRTDAGYSIEESRARLVDPKQVPSVRFYRGAIPLAFAARIDQPIELCSLTLGKLHIVNLPGEPMIEFQLYAQSLLPNAFVAVAGYGDGCCGYLCTDAAYQEGGYEPTDTLVAPGSEAKLKQAIRSLLGVSAAAAGR